MPAKKTPLKTAKYTLGKAGASEFGEMDLTVPSGALCRVRRPGVQGLIKLGLLDSLDSLTALVQVEHIDRADSSVGRAKQAEAIKTFAQNAQAVQDAMDLIDRLIVGCVLEPKIAALPAEGEGRDPEAIYVDSVDLEDKTFILNFLVGGVADVAAFRKERDQLLGDVADQ